MPVETINGTGIFIQEFGAGDPLVLVHGSWVDHMEWPFMVPGLAQRFRVVVYDRRGHGQSERLPAQGSIREDVADLAAIIERAGAPAHVVGSSLGASISLRLAAERPELFRTLIGHEPPLFDLLRDEPETMPLFEEFYSGILPVIDELEAGNIEAGARRFCENILGAGVWDSMIPDEAKKTLIDNAPTFLDETRDPELLTIDLNALSRFNGPVLLSGGSDSVPYFAPVLDRLAATLPNATRRTFDGAGHMPHVTHPQEYVETITAFIDGASRSEDPPVRMRSDKM
jgi:pimeloyl-ACP methyl ester carboxylesterase